MQNKELQDRLERCQQALLALPEIEKDGIKYKPSDPAYWARRSHACVGRGFYLFRDSKSSETTIKLCDCAERQMNRWRRDWMKQHKVLDELTAESQKLANETGLEY